MSKAREKNRSSQGGPVALVTMIRRLQIGRVTWKPLFLITALLAALALFPLAWAYPNFPGDEWALRQFQGFQSGWLNDAAVAVSSIGRVYVFLPLGAALGVAFLWFGRRADAFLVVFSLIPIAAGQGLKFAVDRPRPDFLIAGPDPSGLAFPSGHAIFAIVFGAVLIFLVGQYLRPVVLRRWIQATLVFLVLAIGASRVYLGIHWPSDIIGGFLFGALALAVLFWIRNTMQKADAA
ncbi:MAG: hypothetical protein BZY88_08545 [SAR202 cluster bacterium Io17-Chloro-G9]|nr:MAG: hypothetical protein BZY88_08545 [SAR202 cluster bacterium Io17-Chloro-G9]